MTDPATPDALRAIASMMRMDEYTPDVLGVEALVLDNAADEIERLRNVLVQYRDDLMYPPIGEQKERRIKMVKKFLEGK